jgi:hypothetical protein
VTARREWAFHAPLLQSAGDSAGSPLHGPPREVSQGVKITFALTSAPLPVPTDPARSSRPTRPGA